MKSFTSAPKPINLTAVTSPHFSVGLYRFINRMGDDDNDDYYDGEGVGYDDDDDDERRHFWRESYKNTLSYPQGI